MRDDGMFGTVLYALQEGLTEILVLLGVGSAWRGSCQRMGLYMPAIDTYQRLGRSTDKAGAVGLFNRKAVRTRVLSTQSPNGGQGIETLSLWSLKASGSSEDHLVEAISRGVLLGNGGRRFSDPHNPIGRGLNRL